jgi:hypothetical protein
MRAFSIAPLTLLVITLSALVATAQTPLYKPIPVTLDNPIKDSLSDKDIPTGKRGFARDYIVRLTAGNTVTISVSSDSFDTFVTLIGSDGSVIEENDDGPDGTTNSQIMTKITRTEDYIIRVRTSGEHKVHGSFTLKLTQSEP